ncbi:MAG: trypsin-like peptidase domain-containing protein [Bacteroidales bacterium]|nr:trypsin-like peptidase domain-containing protein [Bacteroidales bacterium]
MLLLMAAVYPVQYVKAQIPHGGQPLQQGAEASSRLRSAVDYFIEMPSFDIDSVLAIDHLPGNRVGGLPFAHKFFVNLSPENSGVVFQTEDGTKVWKVGIRSAGAYSLNILFSDFLLPDGARVFLYNSDRTTVLGSFTNENRPKGGEFSISPVDGDELTIEYHEPANAAFSGKICITEVNHDYRGLFRAGTRFNLTNLPCIPDLSCNNSYDTIGRSVCLLIVNGNVYCTGTLINNTANDGKPYLLTASHCLSNNADIGSRVVAFLNYGSPRCDKRIRGSEEFSLSGSSTRALSNEVDFALLELSEMPPSDYRPYLAGWSLDTITATSLPFTDIHHPYGEVKKYCVEEDSVNRADWVSGNNIAKGNHWHIREWETGHTWTGSSGSALFDKNNKIRGGLTGGESGGVTGCTADTIGDYFFRLDRAWNQFPDRSKQLKCWLDPLTPDSVQSPMALDGMDPYAENPAKRINNMAPSDSMGVINLRSPGWGSIFGHNSLGTTDFAEHFTTADSSMIQGVYLIAAKGSNNSELPITIRIYEGGNKPGKILGKAVLNPNYLEYSKSDNQFTRKVKSYFTNRENYLRLNTPISVGTDFYVGYEITYPIKSENDTFYVYAAIREHATKNTAFFKKRGFWLPYINHSYKPVYTSLWIEPVLSADTITKPNTYYEVDEDSLINKKPIIAYSPDESLLYIDFPDQWEGYTTVEVFDIAGRKVLESKVSPPVGIIKLPPSRGKIFIIRLKNQEQVYIIKLLAGNKNLNPD